ncbi:uncharacterized protein KNAG_0H00100 [Huiozyma naganishii CBS 8797]|uniref:Thiamine transporter n=1 Tax=Huiozyma naganishii (strain ATCC MYA-139 / BCRC 22969 / CBS 8797 / KCTC 17520 / NBRC 10181 / NCYC 3082 / Yp74L-3) TaxID=1071383 RepID=J7R981_HUIN7|nr:hypothetical protein KNAG_0H00100 [Kazachstania naganishii CBS 8797]CCK71425.1 hypothetical protein KNAG_0H00100 [Kazachstania naganishii CBS 8797]
MFFTLANSYPGYDWKVGYTLTQRFVFGIYGSWFGIMVRIMVSIVNYASAAWLGGLAVNMILDSWSQHYLHLPNTLTRHVAMATKEPIEYILFNVICVFSYLWKPHQINKIMIFSCIASCFAMVGMVIYLCRENGGVGEFFVSTKLTVTGSTKRWAWVYMISYWFCSVSPTSTNQSDFSHFGSSQTAIWLGTICALLIPASVIPIFGIIGASTCKDLYGTAFWMPTDIFDYWLKNGYSAGALAAAFFCGVSFSLAQLSFTISNAGFASGMDLAGVLPRYIDIKRGAIFTALASVALQPWNFYNSSSTFMIVMGSFGIVTTPIIAVLICNNLVMRKRRYAVSQGFVLRGEYYYTKGVNWRAMAAWVCGMAPGLPGIAWQVNNNYFHNAGIVNFFYGDSFFSFLISFFLYWVLCLVFSLETNILHDDKDYFDCFTDEEASKEGNGTVQSVRAANGGGPWCAVGW